MEHPNPHFIVQGGNNLNDKYQGWLQKGEGNQVYLELTGSQTLFLHMFPLFI